MLETWTLLYTNINNKLQKYEHKKQEHLQRKINEHCNTET